MGNKSFANVKIPSSNLDLKWTPSKDSLRGGGAATALKVFGILSIIGGILFFFLGILDYTPIISGYGILGIMTGVLFIGLSNIVKLLIKILIQLSR